VAISRPTIAINYYFSPEDLENRIFAAERRDWKAEFMQHFRAYVRSRGGDVVTLDTVDFRDPAVKAVLYFEYSWRFARTDRFLATVPREKRALVLLEPANINPSLYYTSFYRSRFHTVFTWDLNLLRRNPSYVQINVPRGADPLKYRTNPFRDLRFADKKLVVAVNSNRWSYMPQSNYRFRIRAYKHFDRTCPGQFDLFGIGWNQPHSFLEKHFGYPTFAAFRHPIHSYDEKVRTIANYRFFLCIENNAFQPGYISEKLTDCFCARCVPVYYGWKGTGAYVPRDTWIDMRDFRDLCKLSVFLKGMSEAEHRRYLDAIDRFLGSDRLEFFMTEHMFGAVADRLGFPAGTPAGA
jgi:hypothetical protein